MKKIWAGDSDLTIEKLIDKIEIELFDHPTNISWVDDYIKSWAEDNPSAIADASKKTPVKHYDEIYKKKKELVGKESNIYIKDLLDWIL